MKTLLTMQSTLPARVRQRHCPVCQGSSITRISRRRIDRVLSLFTQLKRYRCRQCCWHGNLIVSSEHKHAAQPH